MHQKQLLGSETERRVVTTSLLGDEDMIGRDDVKDHVVSMLQSETHGKNYQVLTIVGIGGVGKTTLVQNVFNDKDIEKHFDLKVWVCVSDDFNEVRLTSEIIESILSQRKKEEKCEHSNDKSLEVHQNRLKDELVGKRFLLILDDVWNEDLFKWDNFRKPFRYGSKGSKILTTSRSTYVAKIMSSVEPIELNGLLDEDFWTLFTKCAFGNSSSRTNQLEEIGRQIVKNLGRLPLAAKTIGYLLQTNMTPGYWNQILESEIWELPLQSTHGIMPLNKKKS